MFCASVAYPIQQGGTFDFDYFATKHVPLFARLLGENCVRFEVHKSPALPGAPAPRFLGVAYFWVKSGEDFGAKLAHYGQEIYADIAHFTDIEPIRQWSEVVQTEVQEQQPLDTVEHALAQEGKPCLAVHHPLDQLHPRHMALDLSVIPTSCATS